MTPEYSQTDPNGYAYHFEDWEKKMIAKALKPVIKKMEKKIQDVYDDPNNEGQATYSTRIDELTREQKCIQEIIDEFKI